MAEIDPDVMSGSFSIPWAATVPNMIDEAAYEELTGVEAPANFSFLLELVIARLEIALRRQLVSAQRTETLRAYRDGIVYPSATPVTAAAGYDFTATTIRVRSAGDIAITYTGGFTAYKEDGAAPIPTPLAASIAWAIHTLANPNTNALPTGIQSINIAGEYVVAREYGSTWGADGLPLPKWAATIADLGGRCASLAAPYRRVA